MKRVPSPRSPWKWNRAPSTWYTHHLSGLRGLSVPGSREQPTLDAQKLFGLHRPRGELTRRPAALLAKVETPKEYDGRGMYCDVDVTKVEAKIRDVPSTRKTDSLACSLSVCLPMSFPVCLSVSVCLSVCLSLSFSLSVSRARARAYLAHSITLESSYLSISGCPPSNTYCYARLCFLLHDHFSIKWTFFYTYVRDDMVVRHKPTFVRLHQLDAAAIRKTNY